MAGRGNPFSRDFSTGNSSESSGFHNPIPKEREHLYSIGNEFVNDLRRHTRAYVKKIGGFPIIHELPRREYKKKDRPIVEDSVLVGDWEELVETSLQEVELPLNQENPETPYISPAHTPVGSHPQSPPLLMAGVNANVPLPPPPNPPPAWRARSPLNLTPPLHDLPQAFEKLLPKFDPNEKILVDDHLQSFYLAIEGLRAGEHEDVVCRLSCRPSRELRPLGILDCPPTLSQTGIPLKECSGASTQSKRLTWPS